MNLLSFVDSFRYPLDWRDTFRRRVLKDIRVQYDWGLEIGVLAEIFVTMRVKLEYVKQILRQITIINTKKFFV